MRSRFGSPNRKTFDTTPLSGLLFASANVIDLAGYNTPEMPSNIKTTKEWTSNDIHRSTWHLEALQDPDIEKAKRFDGVSPVQYKLYRRTLGAKVCFVYGTNAEWMNRCNIDERTTTNVDNDEQAAHIPELIQGLSDFPKDIAVAEYPILETWHVPNHSRVGVQFNNNVFGTIIAQNYGQITDKNNTPIAARKGIASSLRNWYQTNH